MRLSNVLRRVLLSCVVLCFLATSGYEVAAQKKRNQKQESKQEEPLGQESAAIMAAHLAVNEMQRYYEVIRVTPNLETRSELVEQMRRVLETRVVPLTQNKKLLTGEIVACSADSNTGVFGCFPREVALAYLYFGLARASQGLSGEVAEFTQCATSVYPGATKETIYLTKPPVFRDEYSGDLGQTRLEAYPFPLVIEREQARWPRGIRSVEFDLVPNPEELPEEIRISQIQAASEVAAELSRHDNSSWRGLVGGVPIMGLEHLVIEPVDVDSKFAEHFTAIAEQDLRRVLGRLHIYDWKSLGKPNSSVCPDPRKIYLPEGRYALYIEGTKDFHQYFTVSSDSNAFLLEYFYIGNFDSGTASPRVAWYKRAKLCGGKACR